MTDKRPRIGITTSTLDRAPEGPITISTATHVAYSRCVYQAGGLPLLIPNLPEIEDLEEMLSPLDGVLLSGGGDIDPHWWGETPHPALGLVDHVRDRFEIALVRAALRRGLPMLGICRGMQVMVVATGGDIWQDLPSQCPEALPHQQPARRAEFVHDVRIHPGSILARLLANNVVGNDQSLNTGVNSFHHQAPRSCGIVFKAIATSPDGVIEAVAAPAGVFALGVQWHPEELIACAPEHARLFTALVDAARERGGVDPA